MYGTVLGIASGAVVGIEQWLILRKRVYHAAWGALASAAGWVVGGLIGGVVFGVIDYGEGGVVGGIVGGAITGAVLVWLLRYPLPEE